MWYWQFDYSVLGLTVVEDKHRYRNRINIQNIRHQDPAYIIMTFPSRILHHAFFAKEKNIPIRWIILLKS